MLRLCLLLTFFFISNIAQAQSIYGYGTVIGGLEADGQLNSKNFLLDNEEGIRVLLIQSSGSGFNARGAGGGGAVQILDVPKDTDYLELLVFYARINPRQIRKDEIQILRLAATGNTPHLSKNLQRYWTTYNFQDQYDRGGPFDLVRPGDIIIVQARGIFNRPFFDPLTDLNFLISLSTLAFTTVTLYNTFTQ